MSNGCITTEHRNINVMWKTVSEDCNLACDYCYYSTCGGKPGRKINRIDSTILEKFIKEYMERSKGAATFAWQGGEPLLAGHDFFEEVVSLQAKYAPKNTIISNSLQTNGTLLNDKWASFLKTYQFLVGVSLDGPKEIHDARRVDSRGQGSFDRVMKGIGYLRRHQVDFNILTVIHKGNVDKAAEMMRFYESEGFAFVQFIPCMDFRAQEVNRPSVYDITPEEYGRFLSEAFDYWYNAGEPKTSIRFFDDMLSVYVNREAGLCVHRAACPQTIILEQNGDAFPCDFFIHPDWKIGNVGTDSIDEILSHPLYDQFLKMKPTLPEPCKTCEWKKLCHGGCPRNRKWRADRSTSEVDYFCSSYKQIYSYANERMKQLGDNVRARMFQQNVDRYFKGKMPKRNDPCPCGSGKKYKQCCADLTVVF
ncbi:radical SAM domain-containing protein [Neobacillus bataviensis LMG 21833]|uniref:Radical SAM domain-containing protein n=1 Tax=Neobacillus bataviensis LMG 21833 TaxID=1117379 RepID=K6CYD1_9BACI|nr:anaerobic sulfatase maturase [Neobacillus bataviensis]EKN65237.1 radical SAM domain-containing protein [Neobacillus bataviensis LMG 21833]